MSAFTNADDVLRVVTERRNAVRVMLCNTTLLIVQIVLFDPISIQRTPDTDLATILTASCHQKVTKALSSLVGLATRHVIGKAIEASDKD